jgi:type II secretory pathway predicted ATPase ExeA
MLRNFRRFLERNHIRMADLSRALGRARAFVHHGSSVDNFSLEAIGDIETVLEASGYKIPRGLWLTAKGRDIRERRYPLYALGDGRVIAPTCHTRAWRARVAANQVTAAQITERSNSVQPLTPSARNAFNLRFDPFRDEVRHREDVLWTREHKAALDAMTHAARRKSFLAIIGEVGSGKTLCKLELRESLPDNIRCIEPLFPDKARIKPGGLLDAIILDLAERDRTAIPNRNERKARRVRELLEALEKEGQSAVLILDEAHDYGRDAIRCLKRLHELERGFDRLIAIILIGQLELLPKLDDPTIREVQQRCAQFIFRGLGNGTADYLRFKLERAGAKLERIFDESAITAIEKLCRHKVGNRLFGPYPLIVNNVAAAAINTAARLGEKHITAQVVDRAWGTATQED